MFHPNDTAYFVRSNNQVLQVTLVRYCSGRWVVRLDGGGGISLPANRLHPTADAARLAIRPRAPIPSRGRVPDGDW